MPIYSEWHHDAVFGLAEVSDPVDLGKRCDGRAWATVEVQETFVQGLVSAVTYSLYNPWNVSYACQE